MRSREMHVEVANAVPSVVTEIGPSVGRLPDLGELWRYKELLYFLAWRDVKIKYKQSLLGASWVLVQPLLTTVVFTLLFGNLLEVGSDGIPYPLFAYSGLVVWTFFANAVVRASSSLVQGATLITKVYFPRIMVPVASVLSGVIDLAVALTVLIVLMIYYATIPGISVLLFPLVLVLAVVVALGVGIWLSALNVRYRDVGIATPFLVQLWLFITPVVYPSSEIEGGWRFVYALNPMVGIVDGVRWTLFSDRFELHPSVLVSVAVALAMVVLGAIYFRRAAAVFADVV